MEKLYDTLITAQNILNKNEAVVSHENRIITVSKFHQEVKDYKTSMALLGVNNYSNNLSVEQSQQALRDRIIALELPIENLDQEVTAKVLEESVKAKLVDEYHKNTDLSKEEIIFAINQVLAENPKLNDKAILNGYVNSKLEDIKPIRLGVIKIELEKIAITTGNKNLFFLDIEAEINILQQSNTKQLKVILESLKQINQTNDLNHILTVEYICLDDKAKTNVSLDDFKKNTNILVDYGYALNTAYNLIKDVATTSNSSEKFNEKMATISHIISCNNQRILHEYNLLRAEKKQFITQFQFRQALKHFYSLKFNQDDAIAKVKEIINKSYNFAIFHGLVYIHATADEEARGYSSKIDVEDVYNDAINKLKAAGILSIFEFPAYSLAEQQKNKTRQEFEYWINNLLLNPNKSLSSPAPTINSRVNNNYSPSINTEFTSLTSMYNPSLQTVKKNISLSNMYNFGNTCWLNSSLKFIHDFYGYNTIKTAINKKLKYIDPLSPPELQEQLKKVLLSFSQIIEAMSKNEAVNIKIIEFLTNIHNCTQYLPDKHKDKECLDKIDKLLINDVDINGFIDIRKINQQDAIEFVQPFVAFLNLNTESNSLIKRSVKNINITKKDLNDIGLNITKNHLCLNVVSEQKVIDEVVRLPELKAPIYEDLKVEYLTDFCKRVRENSVNYANITSSEVTKLEEDSKRLNHKITVPYNHATTEELYTNIKKLNKFSLDFNYFKRTATNLHERDIDQVIEKFTAACPIIKTKIIDEETNQPYMVEAEIEQMILFRGNKEEGGHYLSISVDKNGKIFIQNDSQNSNIDDIYMQLVNEQKELEKSKENSLQEKLLEYIQLTQKYLVAMGLRVNDQKQLEEFKKKSVQEKLLEYMQLTQGYPVAIGFRVISKTPIN
jgi:translation elongation factor EF-1beta